MNAAFRVGSVGGLLAVFFLVSCETPPPSYQETGARYGHPQASASSAELGTTGNAGNLPPTGQVMYQSTTTGPFGSTTRTGMTQYSGPVVEEYYIGNQPVYSTGVGAQPGYYGQPGAVVVDQYGRAYPVRQSSQTNHLPPR